MSIELERYCTACYGGPKRATCFVCDGTGSTLTEVGAAIVDVVSRHIEGRAALMGKVGQNVDVRA